MGEQRKKLTKIDSILKNTISYSNTSMPEEMVKKIEEGKLIANFAGLYINYNQCNAYMDPIEYEMTIDCPDFLDHDDDLIHLYECDIVQLEFKFHSNWKWLMGVVSKIENLRGEDKSYLFSVDTGRDYCVIRYNDFMKDVISTGSVHNDKMGSIYMAVIRFIEWYNKQEIKLMIE